MIDVSAWSGLQLVEPVTEGNRNEVWRARLDGRDVAVRRSRRSAASLSWELDLLEILDQAGFCVPLAMPCDDGNRVADGVVVQTWLDGQPPSSRADWRAVADELRRLHAETNRYPQRPGCVTVRELSEARCSVDADLGELPPNIRDVVVKVFEGFDDVPVAVVHGDPGPTNIRITADGHIGFLDWDEARVDLTWLDLSNLGVQVLSDDDHRRSQDLANAWEAANAWTTEPSYAAERLGSLGWLGKGVGPDPKL